MKKSTNESPASSVPETSKPYQVPVIWEMFTMEGGFSLLILFPMVVLFFLKKAYESV